MNFDDIMKNIQNNQSVPSQPQDNNNDVTDYSSEANQNFQDAKNNGVTKEQLDALRNHDASNMWTTLFMNMIGAANGIKDTSKYTAPLLARTENERRNIYLQQQAAGQDAQRAMQAQQLGKGVYEQNYLKRQQVLASQPLTNTQKGAMLAYAKQSGQDLDPSDLDNATQDTYQQFMNPLKDVANLGLKQQQLENMAQMYGARGWIPSTDPYNGRKGLLNKFTNQFVPTNFGNTQPNYGGISPSDVPNLQFDDKGKIIGNNSNTNQGSLNANSIISGTGQASSLTPDEIKGARAQLPKLQADYQKNYGTGDVEFNNAYNTVDQLLNESQNGNYKAANSLALQLPRILGGLGKQRITNQEINVENDPTSSGIYNQLVRKVQGLEGNGKITPQDATFIKQSMDALKDQHEKMINSIQNQYRNKAQSLISKPFNDDSYLFGSQNIQNQQPQNNINKSIQPHQSLDDYLGQKGIQ